MNKKDIVNKKYGDKRKTQDKADLIADFPKIGADE